MLLLSLAQRTLSKRVRDLRRRARVVTGQVIYASGETREIDRAWAISADESALMLLSAVSALVSIAVLMARA